MEDTLLKCYFPKSLYFYFISWLCHGLHITQSVFYFVFNKQNLWYRTITFIMDLKYFLRLTFYWTLRETITKFYAARSYKVFVLIFSLSFSIATITIILWYYYSIMEAADFFFGICVVLSFCKIKKKCMGY